VGRLYLQARPENIAGDSRAYNQELEVRYAESSERVSDLLFALDNNDTEYINNKAIEFAKEHQDDIADNQSISEVLNLINSSENSDQAVNSLNDFMVGYGVQASIRREDSGYQDATYNKFLEKDLNNLKQQANDMVTFLSLFPKSSFSELFKLKGIAFNGVILIDGIKLGATTDGSRQDIDLSTGESRLGFDIAPGNTVTHEASHTTFADHITTNSDTTSTPILMLGRLINNKQAESRYAINGGYDENHAEVMANMLMRGGFIDPNRSYSDSEAIQKDQAAILVSMESITPGISAYLARELGALDTSRNILTSFHEQSLERLILFVLALHATLRGSFRKREEQYLH